jgi:predicted ribosome quality control (RQC) complex YloA/Tae2 family protein
LGGSLSSAIDGVVAVFFFLRQTYLLKLASPGKEKVILLLESGARFHTTRFGRDKSDMPSAFAMKLRKHIRSKRLEDVRQISMDRVVDFKFGSGEVHSCACIFCILLPCSGSKVAFSVLLRIAVISFWSCTRVGT